MARNKRNPWSWVPSLYFAEGLPYVIVMTVAGIMYKRMGVENTELAFYTSLLSLPWVIKPFWSPLVDIFGTKRRWDTGMPYLLAAGFAAVAISLPGEYYFRMSLASFLVISFLSATHDIAADGFYMLGLNERQQSFFVGIRTTLYRLAVIAGQGPIVVLAGYFETRYGAIPQAWAMVFYLLAVLFALIAIYHNCVLPHPETDIHRHVKSVKEVVNEFVATFKSFFTKPGIGTALYFLLLYKLPEAQLIRLIPPFLMDLVASGGLGLSTAEVGMTYGTIGVTGLMAGGIAGGIAVSRDGLLKWLRPMAWSMSLTCLSFVYLSSFDNHSLTAINMCVFIEQFGYGFGTTAYILYTIYFSEGEWRTSHYAICTGIMALGMMLPGMAAGKIQEILGYEMFFLWTVVCCISTIGVSYMVKVPASFGKKA